MYIPCFTCTKSLGDSRFISVNGYSCFMCCYRLPLAVENLRFYTYNIYTVLVNRNTVRVTFLCKSLTLNSLPQWQLVRKKMLAEVAWQSFQTLRGSHCLSKENINSITSSGGRSYVRNCVMSVRSQILKTVLILCSID